MVEGTADESYALAGALGHADIDDVIAGDIGGIVTMVNDRDDKVLCVKNRAIRVRLRGRGPRAGSLRHACHARVDEGDECHCCDSSD